MIWEAKKKMLLRGLVRLRWTLMITLRVTLVTVVLMVDSVVARRLFGHPADLSSHPRSGIYHYVPLGASATSSIKCG